MRRPVRSTSLLLLGALMLGGAAKYGCQSHTVVLVTDHSGKPLVGAQVVAVSPSMNTGPNFTDSDGRATVPSNVQGIQWLDISKDGFRPERLDVPSRWPLHVTLQPE